MQKKRTLAEISADLRRELALLEKAVADKPRRLRANVLQEIERVLERGKAKKRRTSDAAAEEGM
jgi:hypothetical protein